MKKSLLEKSAFPMQIKSIFDPVTSDYLSMRFAIEQDVRLVAGNNAARVESLILLAQKYQNEIISDIRYGTINKIFKIPDEVYKTLLPYLKPNPTKADELINKLKTAESFLPDLYCPNLYVVSCWLSGSIGKYIYRLDSYFKNKISFFDGGYGASEIKINIPLKANKSSGALTIFAAFYEFIPLDSNNEEILLAHQLKDQEKYRLIVTTYSGLYRYDMKDIVKVDGFTGTNPNILFISKTSDIGNICGEKITSELIIEIVKRFFDFKIQHFCAIADDKQYCYRLCIEPEETQISTQIDLLQLVKKIELYMYKVNDVYKVFREQSLLNSLKIEIMPKGWYESLIKEKVENGTPINQIKLPVIYKKEPI
jgi:hypothetical protein